MNPHVDDDAVWKHYRKLAHMLNPDKNKSIGYYGAFKLFSEAWNLLSDKDKREAYDEKIKGKPQKGSIIFGGSLTKGTTNGANNSKKKTPSSGKTHKNTAKKPTSSSANTSKSTFWTTCHQCHMKYEYLVKYLNLKLICPNWNDEFVAVETNPPPNNLIVIVNPNKKKMNEFISHTSEVYLKNVNSIKNVQSPIIFCLLRYPLRMSDLFLARCDRHFFHILIATLD